MEKLHFKSFYIKGFSYYAGAEAFTQLEIGSQITLQLESDNHYDENAIALYNEDYKLGYVPRESNSSIAKLLKAGYDIFTGVIQQIDKSEYPDQQIRVGVFINHNDESL
jgi:hypothetical protein